MVVDLGTVAKLGLLMKRRQFGRSFSLAQGAERRNRRQMSRPRPRFATFPVVDGLGRRTEEKSELLRAEGKALPQGRKPFGAEPMVGVGRFLGYNRCWSRTLLTYALQCLL